MAEMLTELDRAIRRENGDTMHYEPGNYVYVAFHKGDLLGVYHSKDAAVTMLDRFGDTGTFTLQSGPPSLPVWGREGQEVKTVMLR